MINIESAAPSEAAAVAKTLRRSIAELCIADHGRDTETVARWTANKTPAFVEWLMDGGGRLLVSRADDGAVACVGHCAGSKITLNYVSPEHRFRGHSTAMLAALEAIVGTSHATGRLTSTVTAHRFYGARGWHDDGAPQGEFGLRGYPMTKQLQ